MKYYVIKEQRDETHVRISDIPSQLRRKYQLLKGVSRLEGWPEDMTARFSAHRPEGMVLTDFVANAFGWLLVSGRFKMLLEELGASPVEYLPLRILNHKERLASDDYWIVNLLGLTAAVDRGQSQYRVDAAYEDKISSYDRLVLREEIVTSGPPILRLKETPRMLLAREDVVERIQEEGLTGMEFIETSAFTTFPQGSSA